jgi:hypothetical protein
MFDHFFCPPVAILNAAKIADTTIGSKVHIFTELFFKSIPATKVPSPRIVPI